MPPKVKYKNWCRWHLRCSDIDNGKPGTACGAHLNEGRVFRCSYNSLVEAKRNSCMDAGPPEKTAVEEIQDKNTTSLAALLESISVLASLPNVKNRVGAWRDIHDAIADILTCWTQISESDKPPTKFAGCIGDEFLTCAEKEAALRALTKEQDRKLAILKSFIDRIISGELNLDVVIEVQAKEALRNAAFLDPCEDGCEYDLDGEPCRRCGLTATQLAEENERRFGR